MQIPNIPTDNLYKFLSLSGIIILLFSIVYPNYLNKQLNELVNENITSIGIMKIESKYLEQRISKVQKDGERLEKNLQKYQVKKDSNFVIDTEDISKDLQDEKRRDFLKFVFQYEDKLIPEREKFKKIKKELNELQELQIEAEINDFKIRRKEAINNERLTELHEIYLKALMGKWFGIVLSIIGFSFWYRKVQKFLDKKIQLEVEQYISRA